jgi:hypothetical protein
MKLSDYRYFVILFHLAVVQAVKTTPATPWLKSEKQWSR